MEIICGEGDQNNVPANGDRVFQFRFKGQTQLEFNAINASQAGGAGGDIVVNLPTSGDDFLAVGTWYHVAVTYDGVQSTANNLKFYWTKMDPANTAAHLLGQGMLTNDLITTNGNVLCDFSIGNEARDNGGNINASTESLLGWEDSVRISAIPRDPGDMIFVPEPATGVLALIGVFGFGLWLRRKRK